MNLQRGSKVKLITPGNPKLHLTEAVVQAVEEWGAHVSTSAAATGHYRAGWEEMTELHAPTFSTNGHSVTPYLPAQSFTGNICLHCGSSNMVRNGICEVCLNCGSTNGCS